MAYAITASMCSAFLTSSASSSGSRSPVVALALNTSISAAICSALAPSCASGPPDQDEASSRCDQSVATNENTSRRQIQLGL